MSTSRREFLKNSFGTVLLIGIGNSLQSFLPATFLPPSKGDVLLRFAMASDGHYGQPNTEYQKHHEQMIGWLNSEKKGRGLDFIVINGDLIHDDANYLPQVKAIWKKLKAPHYVTHGNHDMIDEKTWKKTWGIGFDHSFEKKDAAVIILNTADEKGNYTGPDLEVTKALLDRHRLKKDLFVFMHITPVKWTTHGIDRPDIVSLFSQQKNLRAIFHGHDHDKDGMQEKDGKYYFWDAHIAGNWGTTYKGYRIVEVLKNGNILIYQMNPLTGATVNSNTIR